MIGVPWKLLTQTRVYNSVFEQFFNWRISRKASNYYQPGWYAAFLLLHTYEGQTGNRTPRDDGVGGTMLDFATVSFFVSVSEFASVSIFAIIRHSRRYRRITHER